MAAGRQFKLQKLLEFSHFLEDHIGPPPSLHNSDTGAREGRTQVLPAAGPSSILLYEKKHY